MEEEDKMRMICLGYDHLVSWTMITDAQNDIEQEVSFDAWGNLRDPDTRTSTITQQPMFDQGYIGHEHLNFSAR